ncbi:MAG: hypothetical protein GX282_08265 [Campylobacteraceae bacterium]|nr:hypothetical protein [Campylobacteraceae bacterium]
MPIPVFVAGLAVGAGLVVAYNNKDKIKESIVSGVEKGKDLASDAKEKVCKSKKDECPECVEAKEAECKEVEAKTEAKTECKEEEPKAETKAEPAKAEPKSTTKKEAK